MRTVNSLVANFFTNIALHLQTQIHHEIQTVRNNYWQIEILFSHKTIKRNSMIWHASQRRQIEAILQDNLSEWLRRQTRNLLGFARAGSNPAVVAFLFSNQSFLHSFYSNKHNNNIFTTLFHNNLFPTHHLFKHFHHISILSTILIILIFIIHFIFII